MSEILDAMLGGKGREPATGTRAGLIEAIAVASALAWTANTDTEYMHWDNRRADLEKYAGSITDGEMATITRISIAKQDAYNSTEDTQDRIESGA
jgi:hypothetical protein